MDDPARPDPSWGGRRAVGVDVTIAVASAAVGLVLLAAAAVEPGEREPDALAVALVLAHVAAVPLRRRAPVPALALAGSTALALAVASYPVAVPPVALLVVFTAGGRVRNRRWGWAFAATVVGSWLVATAAPGPTEVLAPVLVAAVWWLGRTMGALRDANAALAARAVELERAQRGLAERAVAEERVRVARELHDVVAHGLGAIAVQAGTGRLVARADPAAAERSLVAIEGASREALAEMRQLLGLLRATPEADADRDAHAPLPGLADLDALVAGVVGSGLVVELEATAPQGAWSPAVELTAFRVVQEALTNALRHAGPTTARVHVAAAGADLVVEVVDDGPATAAVVPTVGTGLGLVGMRERVAALGGALEVGPHGPGWRVAVRLPGEGAR